MTTIEEIINQKLVEAGYTYPIDWNSLNANMAITIKTVYKLGVLEGMLRISKEKLP